MEPASDDLNATQWVAVIGVFVVLAAPLAVALAWWCKRRYARAVVALQRQTAPAAAPVQEAPPPPAAAPTEALAIDTVALDAAPADAMPDALVHAERVRARVLLAQGLMGAGLWLALLIMVAIALVVLAQATGEQSDDSAETSAWAHLFLWPLLAAPPLLAWAFQAGWRESRVWIGFGIAFAAMAVAGVGFGGSMVESLAIVAAMAAAAAIPLAFMRPAFRGAGPPLVLALTAGMAVFWTIGAVAAAFDDSDPNAPMTAADWWGVAWGLPLMLAVAGWCAWRLLLRLARRYGEKRFSDVALAHSAYWSLVAAFTASTVLMVSFEERTGGSMEWVALAVFVLWALWRAVQRRVVAGLARSAPARGPALLVLRVFKPSARSESFMDRLLARWRFVGPTWMIAGPDLAGAFMEPDEFFVWLRRRLRERFIADPSEVGSRVDALDNARDPDGRFRVSELFCADSTWKPAVLALMDRADVVLLDLREFTPERRGTHFELVQLLRRA
ncbi:MAG TPA: hypothetical protein VFQ20_04685, partial [Burkholderiaceae bacterium]|nr:hypothetical protein [Burkholderiaceae bacterium]